jgi:uncharacterized protein
MSTFQFPGRPRNPQNPAEPRVGRSFGLGGFIVVALVLAIIGFIIFSNIYVDALWFKSVNYFSVWSKILETRIILFLLFGLLTTAFFMGNVYIAYRLRPIYVPTNFEADPLDRYRAQLDAIKRYLFVGLTLVVLYFTGMAGSRLWTTWLPFIHSQPFGKKDPQFHLDISFFTFKLPFYTSLISWAVTLLVLTLIATGVIHYLYGGLRFRGATEKASVAARVQFSILFGALSIVKAIAYWFDRYQLTVHNGRLFTGLSYTDVNALIPAKNILAGIAVICAGLFFFNIVRRSWALPIVGVALMAISSVIIAGIYPSLIQQFSVNPSESVKEAPYILRNISATKDAYNLSNVKVVDYSATTNTSAKQLAQDADNVANVRLLDPYVVSDTYRQLQQIKPYYTFPDSLAFDRYMVNGKSTDEVVAVRELNIAGAPVQNWINNHLVYTHGFGFVAAPSNQVDSDGKPNFTVGNIPPTSGLGNFQPRIYFGQNVPDYSIVGGTAKSTPAELDYPDDSQASGQQNYTYQGKGGVSIGNYFNKLVFATHLKEIQILLSNLINKDSKILYLRNPRDRVQKVAPWLTLDGDQYPAIVNGRIVWIIDGYTTSAAYPNSQMTNLMNTTNNSLTQNSNTVQPLPDVNANYIRNSVKATVDAYDGTVNLYQWDKNDPVLKVWSAAFPGLIKPASQMSTQLLQHVRYPADIFSVQRSLLSTYHVSTSNAFYGGQDFWRVPTDPASYGGNQFLQPPYYMTMRLPGATKSNFSLVSSFVPKGNRQNLTSFAVANSDAGANYGQITVLQLPRSTNIAGPSQVASNFESAPQIAQTLSLLRQGGSDVVLGNLITLPVGGGLLYVQPVYVKSTNNGSSYPLLQKVMVSFGNSIGFDDTLQGALTQVFGASVGSANSGTSSSTATTNSSSALPSNLSLKAALSAASQAITDGQAALANGNFAAYGQAQAKLKAAIADAIKAEGGK